MCRGRMRGGSSPLIDGICVSLLRLLQPPLQPGLVMTASGSAVMAAAALASSALTPSRATVGPL